MQSALREDALTSTPTGISVRIGLPWIRSLPLACVSEPQLVIDGVDSGPVRIAIGYRSVKPHELIEETAWWFAQDRLVLTADHPVAAGTHDVVVSFGLLIPYLMAGPGGGPLQLPMRLAGTLQLDHEAVPSVSLDVA